MFPFHVSVDQTRDWLDYAQFAATIVAALGTMIVATLIVEDFIVWVVRSEGKTHFYRHRRIWKLVGCHSEGPHVV